MHIFKEYLNSIISIDSSFYIYINIWNMCVNTKFLSFIKTTPNLL